MPPDPSTVTATMVTVSSVQPVNSRLVSVVGPTASGKSELGVSLALRIGGATGAAEIVNADSMQLYRGMDVGTAKVTAAEQRGIPHHLIDMLDVTDAATVAEFQGWARNVVAHCHERGVLPLLVGGSSLYVRAVIDRLDFPGTSPVVRARWEARLAELGSEELHLQLAWLDPDAADLIQPSNARRIVRALEVIELTGSFAASMPPYESIYDDVCLIGLDVPRDVLDLRIAERVDRMWEAGLVEEVRTLMPRGLADSPTAAKAIGYEQALGFLAGRLTEAEAREATVTATKAFARRQDRLFRKDPRIHWLPFDSPTLVDDAVLLSAGAVADRP